KETTYARWRTILLAEPRWRERMSQGNIDREQTTEVSLTAAINATAIAPHRRWLGLSVALGVGSVTLAFGATCYRLSQALLRPRLKRLSQLKSPHLRHLLKRRNIHFE